MDWFLSRAVAAVALITGAAALGHSLGQWLGAPIFLAWAAGSAALVGLLLLDGRRARILAQWVQSRETLPRPGPADIWGELAYRFEREFRKERELREQERARLADYVAAIEASPNGVVLLDEADHIVWCNGTAAEHLGLNPKSDLGQPITHLLRYPALAASLHGASDQSTLQLTAARGRGVISAVLRRYGQGMRLLLTQDVTEREAAEHMRRDFVANVSHEIRTPLTVLAGFIETMGSVPLTDVEQARVLSLMAQQSQRMQSLVNDLLTLAKLEGGPRPPTDRWVDVRRLLKQVEGDARMLSAGTHQLSFRCDEPGEVSGEEGEVLSAVSNLVANAVRYTPPERQNVRGRVDVTWRILPDGRGELEVSDNGPGIDKEHLPRITERFYRADSSRSRDTGGTGLGLSIVKHVMLRHGGGLDVSSDPGKGSTFRLQFPASRVRALQAAVVTNA